LVHEGAVKKTANGDCLPDEAAGVVDYLTDGINPLRGRLRRVYSCHKREER